jgi:Fic family protein
VPSPLPPLPSVDLARFQILLEQANQAIGRLDGLASLLPDLSLLLYTYVRKEAILSSQIEAHSRRCPISCATKTMRHLECL